MPELIGQEIILITSATVSVSLSKSLYVFSAMLGYTVYAEVIIGYQPILFSIDGSNPTNDLQLYTQGNQGDMIKLINIAEVAGFRAVKIMDNATLNISYYKE